MTPSGESMSETSGRPGPDARTGRSVPFGWVLMVVVGGIITLMSVAPMAGGGFLVWADATQKDGDGFFSSPEGRLETTAHAITSDDIDLGADPTLADSSVDLGDIVTLRLDVQSTSESSVFVGIGPRDDVQRYLSGVGRATIDDLSFDPFAVSYRYTAGGAPSAAPGTEDLWVASADGPGRQTVEWEPENGDWTVVVMNADGSEGVSVDAAIAAKSPWVLRVGVALLVGGALGLLVGAVLLVVGVVGLARGSHLDLAGPAAAGPPVQVDARLDEPLSRWLWLVKWVLLIPHLIVLVVLWVAFAVVTFVAFFAILFTARYPRALFEFNVGVLRWTWRVTYYGYSALGTDRYPPFTLGESPDYPATLSVAHPERLSRGLVLVKWWLLAIPQYLVLALIGGSVGTAVSGDDWRVPFGGLLTLLVLFAAVALLFLGRYPKGLYDLVVGLNRWVYRVLVYVALMRDEYPPFRLDQGGAEPVPRPAPADRAMDVSGDQT